MDQEYPVDVDEVRRRIDHVEVVALFFPYFGKTLLVDTRSSSVDRPLVRVVRMARSAEERIESLCRMRPRLGRPDSMVLIPWPRSVASAKTLGVWQMLAERLSATSAASEVELERCYRRLLREEQLEYRRAVTGEGYRTLWQRPRDEG